MDKYTVTLDEMERWRRYGPLGKLHNFVVYIQRSTIRIQRFKKLSHGRALVRDNSTRWNSWYTMIECAISPGVREAITRYFATYIDDECAPDELLLEDWAIIDQVKQFLEYFVHVTKALEGHTATLDEALPAMDFVLEQLEQGKERYQDDKYMSTACNSGWAKLDKYYSKTSDSPAYAAAVVLHPSNKWQEIENSWCPEWIPSTKSMVKQFWESKYKPKVGILSESSSNLTSKSTDYTESTENTYRKWQKDRKRAQAPIDEYDQFIQSELVCDIEDTRRWWLEETQQKV